MFMKKEGAANNSVIFSMYSSVSSGGLLALQRPDCLRFL